MQVLVQSHLLLDSDLTTDSVIGDNPPAVNGDQGTFSAYPVPQNVRSAVNMTIVTTDKAAAKVRRAHLVAAQSAILHESAFEVR